jgi:Ectropic viral integration site 2A protein (EVI2A)
MVNDLSLSEEDASMGTNSEQEDNSTTRNTASGEKEGEGSTSSSQGKIGKAETVAVNRSKVIVYVCLIIFSIAMSLTTYVYVASEENSDFETAVRVFYPFEHQKN